MSEPLKPAQVRHWVAHYMHEHEMHAAEIPPMNNGWKGLLRGKLNNVLPDSVDRYFMLGWVFGKWGAVVTPMSSKELTEAQWFALRKWVGETNDSGQWNIRGEFEQEARWVAWERTKPVQEVEVGRDPMERLKLGGDGVNGAVQPQVTEILEPVGGMVEELIKLGGQVVEVGPPEMVQAIKRVRKAPEVFKFD